MHAHTAADTAALLPYPELADALAEVLRLRQAGIAIAPPRLIMPLAEDGLLLVMPATDGEIAITKLATAHTRNAARGLPSIQAEVFVMESATGRRLFSLDGAVVTARRTAALSLLAARILAPDPSGALLIVGAGTLGRSHLDAFADGLGTRRVFIASRSRASAEALAAYAVGRGLDASVIVDVAAAATQASLIVTATTSATPVLPEAVRQDVMIAAVGAFKPGMAEVPPGLARAARVVVDSMEGAQAEAGDLIQAGIDWSAARAIEDVLSEPRPARGQIVFKSVGHALWDLAAARLAATRIRANAIG
ncbi:MAG TPA: delta(1)-pyrroline-2-carboxylate reductase family protein [Thermoflexales bacterium]|nr:delta(1)-pyrroline-2-carboxylate reductase family protein [Thermoflexales bacterium]HQY25478.1 delta(1)-pyrroline-2-carboxylate reductase family protein [Thermoflexales bacterium]